MSCPRPMAVFLEKKKKAKRNMTSCSGKTTKILLRRQNCHFILRATVVRLKKKGMFRYLTISPSIKLELQLKPTEATVYHQMLRRRNRIIPPTRCFN